jgi:hypothetical protein
MHLDMTPFNQIIDDWYEERLLIESSPMGGAAWGVMPDEEQDIARHQSIMSKLKVIVWQLKQQHKDTEMLSKLLSCWVVVDRRAAGRIGLDLRKRLLYKTLEDYFNGQGYATRG